MIFGACTGRPGGGGLQGVQGVNVEADVEGAILVRVDLVEGAFDDLDNGKNIASKTAIISCLISR